MGLDSSDLKTELIDHPAEVDATDSMGKSALSWAASRGDEVAVQLLLKANANPNLVDIRGSSVLSLAVRSDNTICTRLILAAHADIHGEGSYNNALHIAAEHNNRGDIVRLLVEAGIDTNV